MNSKFLIITVSILLLLVVVISIVLPGIPLKKGGDMLFLYRTDSGPGTSTAPIINAVTVIRLVIAFTLFTGLAYVVFLIINSILNKKNRKELKGMIIFLLCIFILLVLLDRNKSDDDVIFYPENPHEMGGPGPITDIPQEDKLPQLHDYRKIYLIGLYSMLGISILIILFKIFKKNEQPDPIPNYDDIIDRATRVRDAVAAKNDNAIIQCYIDMCTALQTHYTIDRNTALTAHEFQALLIKEGFPGAPISELTALFENFRYGNVPLTDEDRKQAITALTMIINYCTDNPAPVKERKL